MQEKSESPSPKTIYASSKLRHIPLWKKLRAQGLPIISSWIDYPGQDGLSPQNRKDLSILCLEEVRKADIVLLYCEEIDILKGALIEAGAALSYDHEVRCVGTSPSLSPVFNFHPLWKTFPSIEAATADIEKNLPKTQKTLSPYPLPSEAAGAPRPTPTG